MKKIKIIVENTDTGLSAYAKDYPVYTTGIDHNDMVKNILEGLNFYFEDYPNQPIISESNLVFLRKYTIGIAFTLFPFSVTLLTK